MNADSTSLPLTSMDAGLLREIAAKVDDDLIDVNDAKVLRGIAESVDRVLEWCEGARSKEEVEEILFGNAEQPEDTLERKAFNALTQIEFLCQETETAAKLSSGGHGSKRVHIDDLREIYRGIALDKPEQANGRTEKFGALLKMLRDEGESFHHDEMATNDDPCEHCVLTSIANELEMVWLKT